MHCVHADAPKYRNDTLQDLNGSVIRGLESRLPTVALTPSAPRKQAASILTPLPALHRPRLELLGLFRFVTAYAPSQRLKLQRKKSFQMFHPLE